MLGASSRRTRPGASLRCVSPARSPGRVNSRCGGVIVPSLRMTGVRAGGVPPRSSGLAVRPAALPRSSGVVRPGDPPVARPSRCGPPRSTRSASALRVFAAPSPTTRMRSGACAAGPPRGVRRLAIASSLMPRPGERSSTAWRSANGTGAAGGAVRATTARSNTSRCGLAVAARSLPITLRAFGANAAIGVTSARAATSRLTATICWRTERELTNASLDTAVTAPATSRLR